MINQQLNELIKKAQGERTQNQYALHCGVGSSTITRFLKGERSPTPDILKKLAEKAYNGVTYDDFMRAAYGTTSVLQKDEIETSTKQKKAAASPQPPSVSTLSNDEQLLLDYYRRLAPKNKTMLFNLMKNIFEEARDLPTEQVSSWIGTVN